MTTHPSSTATVPLVSMIPSHIAIIMDGNGRWATKRFLPRVTGHVKGVDAVRRTVEACALSGVQYLTLFAFSSENWRRPADEVSLLMRLFITVLDREVAKMHVNGIRLKVVGELGRFDDKLRAMIDKAERRTAGNTGLTVTICANYGGRWDIMQAMNQLVAQQPGRTDFNEDELAPFLSMAYAPEPDLFIRTGGEERVSNFLLWQLAYSEMYFTDSLWPDFDSTQLQLAITSYQQRERRFGRTSEQLVEQKKAS
jgi:undecaprenyl diphosphate synthase